MNEVRKVNMIEVQDWDNLVINTYGKPYSFQQQDGCQLRGIINITIPDEEAYDDEMNESIPEMVNGPERGVKFDTWLGRDPNEPLKDENEKDGKEDWMIRLFWLRNFHPELQTVANNLHKKGLIEAGDYIINIDW